MIWHSSELNEIQKEFNVSFENGYTNGSAYEKLQSIGKNSITNLKKPSFFRHFIYQLKSKSAYILSIIAVITLIFNIIYNKSDIFSPILIIGIIILNSLISAFQLYRSEIALDNLKSITNPNATVIRDGVEKTINSEELVTGDIIKIKSGDIVPADVRLIDTLNFSCNEFILTGEDIPVNKHSDILVEDIAPINQRINMAYSGCVALTGTAKGVVVETGLNTEIGRNSAINQQAGEDILPIQKRLEGTEKILNISIFAICFVIFIISLIINFKNIGFASTTATSLLNAMALAVAAIPEGLPAISTIAIALGIERIIRDDIIIKKVKALEVIGKTSVICSDKTGIITTNSMFVKKLFDGTDFVEINDSTLSEKHRTIIKLAAVCSTLENDSTEASIKKCCLEYCGSDTDELHTVFPRVGIIPFDSERKTMTSINMINGKPVAIVKGAPEVLADKFSNIDAKLIDDINQQMANEALRIICIGIKTLDEIPANPSSEIIENDLIFVGLIGIDDPPRTSTIDAIKVCDRAGIKTVMITGDNLTTAKAVARRVGILKDGTLAISGNELENISDEELPKVIGNYSVFARITPNDKLRIIDAFQRSGKIVTITGNGFKDAQALANADIGCAMGKFGTDVARGNADIIINNSHFESIINTIKESRGLFANIQKAVAFLISCNLAELAIYFICLLVFKKPPISAVQILWINLLTDCAPVLALSTQKAEKYVMNYSPAPLSGRIFDNRSLFDILINSAFISVVSIISFVIGYIKFGSYGLGMTMLFVVLGLTEILHAFNLKDHNSIFKNKFEFSGFLATSSILVVFIILFLVLTPAGYVFGLETLNGKQLFICIGLSILIILFSELLKFIKKIVK